MRIEHLSLKNFRNYKRLELRLPEGTILLHGKNAQGKTNLLEAIYYLATSTSPYTTSDRQLINWSTEHDPMPFAQVGAEIITSQDSLNRLEIILAATDLVTWSKLIGFTDHPGLATCEIETFRYRVLHVAARITRGARQIRLRIDATWRWATVISQAWQRLRAAFP